MPCSFHVCFPICKRKNIVFLCYCVHASLEVQLYYLGEYLYKSLFISFNCFCCLKLELQRQLNTFSYYLTLQLCFFRYTTIDLNDSFLRKQYNYKWVPQLQTSFPPIHFCLSPVTRAANKTVKTMCQS